MRAVNEPAFNVPLVSVTVPPGTHRRSCSVYVPPEPLMVKPPNSEPLDRMVPPAVVRVSVTVPVPQKVPELDQLPATLIVLDELTVPAVMVKFPVVMNGLPKWSSPPNRSL